MRMIIYFVFVIVFVLLAFVIEEDVTARWSVRRVERINARMAALRDRVKAVPPDTNALSLLIEALHAKDPWERGAATGFLGQAGSNAAPAVDDLIEILNGNDPFDARLAADSLGEIGHSAHRAVPALVKAVEGRQDEDVGWFAAESLGQIGTSNDTKIIAVLKKAANSPVKLMRQSAIRGLQELGITNDVTAN